MKATQHLPEAAELAIWLTTNPEVTKMYTTKQFLFPCTTALLTSPEFAGQKMDFYGGQAVNEVFAKSAAAVPAYEWSPFQDFFYQSVEPTRIVFNDVSQTGLHRVMSFFEQ